MTTATTEYRFADQIGHLLRRAYQRHVAIFQQTVPDAQLTAAQFVVLCSVRDRPGCAIADIVAATAIDEDSVRGIVERLKWRKCLVAEHEPGDTRRTRLTLTPEGTAMVEQTVPFAREISELTYGALSADERVAIVALLRKISGI
ncbi:MAG: MarR family winged helix-turn-helix transcriptional regulator [Pseudomonadota bacterium]|nr:MarR family winged helix-turn-helix transcriptional regulator [Pseudomonadota bacterium]